jgi:carbamoyl-phosphate synthase large subunit
MRKINILLSSIGKKIWLYKLFIQAAMKFKSSIDIFVADSNPLAPAMLAAGEINAITLPTIESPFYYSELQKAIVQFGIDKIIPTIDSEVTLISSFPNALCCSPELATIALDKYLTSIEWKLFDIPTPHTLLIKNIKDSFPGKRFFVKPRRGGTSVRAREVMGRELDLLARLEPDLVIQEIQQGQEFTLDMLFLERRFIHCHPRLRLVVSQGEAVTCRSFEKDLLEPSIGKLINWLEVKGANGFLNVQGFIHDSGGITYTEINPRVSAGFMHSYIAGAFYPEAILAELTGEAIPRFIESLPNATTLKHATCKIIS